MAEIMIKYATILICSFYIYIKLLHIQTRRRDLLVFALFLVLMVPTIYLLRVYLRPLSVFIMVACFICYVGKLTKQSLYKAVNCAVMSFGYVYVMLFTATLLVSGVAADLY